MLYTRENDVLPKTIAGKENAKAYFTTLTMDLSRLTMDLRSVTTKIKKHGAFLTPCPAENYIK